MTRQSAYMFFKTHAGYGYDPETETREQGRRRTAKALVNAERKAEDLGLRFEWLYEISPDTSWMDAEQLAEYGEGSIEMLECVCRLSATNEVLASCGGIAIDTSDYPSNYRRVMEAELALEAIAKLESIGSCI